MPDRIKTMRTVANNLTSHLFMEGKNKIKKPSVIIPGAISAIGTALTLETKNNSATLVVKKGGTDIQNAVFEYSETPSGYELISARSSYSYDDKARKAFSQNQYSIEQGQEHTYENYINYKNAPMRKTTKEYIDKINSSVAQMVGYKSSKTDYDPQESHTYGKKSLERDIPVLLKILDVIAPNADFTLKMKDKLKKDNQTSLVAFEVNEKGQEIAKGFLSANGDAVSYHIDTAGMTIIGEKSPNISMSRAYLKPENPQSGLKEIKEHEHNGKANGRTGRKAKYSKEDLKDNLQKLTEQGLTPSQIADVLGFSYSYISVLMKEFGINANKAKRNKQVKPTTAGASKHIFPVEYYTNLIEDVVANTEISNRKDKIANYKRILALAYNDGYRSQEELENILTVNGKFNFTSDCKRLYINSAILMAKNVSIMQPNKTLEYRLKELNNIKINVVNEELESCFRGMIGEISKIKYVVTKEMYIDKAYDMLKTSSPQELQANLESFIKDAATINDNLKLYYEIYEESVYNANVETLKSQIEHMIANISDLNNYEKRDDFLTRLYVANDSKNLKMLEQLRDEVQIFLNGQSNGQNPAANPSLSDIKLSIDSLSVRNRDFVMKLLNCKSPSDISMTFEQARNLLLNIGFVETGVRGTHYKFRPPLKILFNGVDQPFITLSVPGKGSRTLKAATIDDLILVCKQYYDVEA